MIGSLNTVPEGSENRKRNVRIHKSGVDYSYSSSSPLRMFLIVPFGLLHMDFRLNSSTLASSAMIFDANVSKQECLKTTVRSITKFTWCNGCTLDSHVVPNQNRRNI
jgi:hypothetical protein